MKKNLVKVSTFAREQGVSTNTVYVWIRSGALESVEIDGVKFVVPDNFVRPNQDDNKG